MVKPRLQALIHLRNSLDNEFNLYSFMPRMYPFFTNIKADLLIASHIVIDSYVFIIHTTPNGDARIHIPSNTTTILLDKLNTEGKTNRVFIGHG